MYFCIVKLHLGSQPLLVTHRVPNPNSGLYHCLLLHTGIDPYERNRTIGNHRLNLPRIGQILNLPQHSRPRIIIDLHLLNHHTLVVGVCDGQQRLN